MATPASKAAESLRAKQKPLKDSYRTNPHAALITLKSSGSLDPTSSSLTCSLNPSTASAAKRVAGLHAAAGGEGFDASGELCSGDMLLESLVACFGVTVRAVATAMGIEVKGGSVTVSGELDFRGTMGVKDENGGSVEVGFKSIGLVVRVEVGDEDREKVGKLVELAERYCVVLQTLKKGLEVGVEVGDARKDGEEVNVQDGKSGEGAKEGSMEKVVINEEVLKLQ